MNSNELADSLHLRLFGTGGCEIEREEIGEARRAQKTRRDENKADDEKRR